MCQLVTAVSVNSGSMCSIEYIEGSVHLFDISKDIARADPDMGDE